MSKVIFVKCANKECKNRSYPIDAGNEEMLKLCPECDPKSHHALKVKKQQATMISNKPLRQRLDAGRVESLQEGAAHIVIEDKPGVEVDVVHATPDVNPNAPEVPIITASEAKIQAAKGKQISRKPKGKK